MNSLVRGVGAVIGLGAVLVACADAPAESTQTEAPLISDAQTITQNPDGTFDVVCKDGRKETVSQEVILANKICDAPYVGKSASGRATVYYDFVENFGTLDTCRYNGGGHSSETYDVSISVDANNVATLTLKALGQGLMSQALQCADFPSDTCKDMTTFTVNGRLVAQPSLGDLWMASASNAPIAGDGRYSWAITAHKANVAFAVDVSRVHGDCAPGTLQQRFKVVMDGFPTFGW
jgi:hypothetical protein